MTTDIQLRFWKRYVDDTCTALPAHRLQELLDHLNRVEPSIQFTVETESEGRVPFLGVFFCNGMWTDPSSQLSIGT